jgi:Negative regulator of genetic competence, sporulation and motility
MKLEKLNDNQIRCTLTKRDLSSRNMSLRELAYGSENARTLFHEMMEQASIELNFQVDNTPLMIEAIPSKNEGIILLITKIEDPEELDTRFSTFSPSNEANNSLLSSLSEQFSPEGLDSILNAFQNPDNSIEEVDDHDEDDNIDEFSPTHDTPENTSEALSENSNLIKIFSFKSLDEIIYVSKLLNGKYMGENTLYKEETNSEYLLVINKIPHTPLEFNCICNLLLEYSEPIRYNPAFEALLEEHFSVIFAKTALQSLTVL